MTEESTLKQISLRMVRDEETVTHTTDDGFEWSYRETWSVEDARTGLVDAWLADLEAGNPFADEPRTIRGDDGPIAHLVSHEEWCRLLEAEATLTSDAYSDRFKSKAYKPFLHPGRPMERFIGTDFLESWMEKRLAEAAEQGTFDVSQIHMDAFMASLLIELDEDSHGRVPMLVPDLRDDAAGTDYVWRFVERTPVLGLFLYEQVGFFGSEWALRSGSGYKVVGGLSTSEHARELAVKLHEAVPGIDWMVLQGPELTAEVKATMWGVIKEHGKWPADRGSA